jgi:hypothetical protein
MMLNIPSICELLKYSILINFQSNQHSQFQQTNWVQFKVESQIIIK